MAGKKQKPVRPDWDTYFMQIAQVVALEQLFAAAGRGGDRQGLPDYFHGLQRDAPRD